MEKNKGCISLLAHVDAGKTTLSERLLYETGVIKSVGRVDQKNTYFDNDSVERERGITIYSKNARISLPNNELVLIDTPGHIDFSAETERCFSVLDAAVLLVSASAGIQPHTKTLWSLLKYYRVPTYIFVNKIDMPDTFKESVFSLIKSKLSGNAVDFSEEGTNVFFEEVATCGEGLLNEYLENDSISAPSIKRAIKNRELFPVFFGSALKNTGIPEFIIGLDKYMIETDYDKRESEDFSGRVYKISRDNTGKRLTFLKVTSGSIKVKDMLGEEKINELRIYSGEKYEAVKKAVAGEICAVVGIENSQNGTVYGKGENSSKPLLAPALSYAVHYPSDVDRNKMLSILKEIEEEDPSLNVEYKEDTKEIFVSLMGDVRCEVLKRTLSDRYNIKAEFGDGRICYKETIDATSLGVGHFEPLRHYAEAQILLEPLERGSGLEFEADVSEDLLDRNWQRLVLTHMAEREHRGVLLGTPITDLKMTLVAGRAHIKHTEGGDFRQATYRAIRQGLMKLRVSGNVRILEPFYDYTLEVPTSMAGRAMTDIAAMSGTAEITETDLEEGISVLTGRAPVSTMKGYMKEVISYTKGTGKLMLNLSGYDICHNEEEVLAASTYNPDADLRNPSSSVFCSHGAGTVVNWDEVDSMKHVEYTKEGGAALIVGDDYAKEANRLRIERERKANEGIFISVEEVDNILKSSTHANENGRKSAYKGISVSMRERNSGESKKINEPKEVVYKGTVHKEKYMLVDGYNVIHAWKELDDVAAASLPAAVLKLNEILSNYQAINGIRLIVVYDAYKVVGHHTEEKAYDGMTVVFTKEAQTADQYIERYAHENAKKFDITVVTSDGLEQIIVTGEGCNLISSREFEKEVKKCAEEFNEKHGVLN